MSETREILDRSIKLNKRLIFFHTFPFQTYTYSIIINYTIFEFPLGSCRQFIFCLVVMLFDNYALPAEGQLVWELRADALNQSIIYLMNSKNEIAKKDLQLTFHKGTTPHIQQIQKRQLITCQHNITTTSLVINAKTNKEKGNDPKSEDKDNTTSDTAGTHVEDTEKNEDITAPSGGASLGAHVSETSQATSRPLRTVEGILGAHPIDGTFWDNINPADMSVDTVTSEE